MKKDCFERPTQVAFYNIEEDCYDAGIADDEWIICLCCGGTIHIGDFLEEMAEERPDVVPIIELPWVNLREECLGDAMFDANSGEIMGSMVDYALPNKSSLI